MKKILEHIKYMQGKPHHVRKQIAFMSAALGSALIALIWFVSSYATGAFAIKETSFAMSLEQNATIATTSESGDQNIAGAAAALRASEPVHIEIVDTTPKPAPKKQSDQTILPF